MSKSLRFNLAVIGSAVAALALAPIAFAGPVDPGKQGRAIYDFNADGKSDLPAQKVSGSNVGLVQIKQADGTSAFLGTTFPTTLSAGNVLSGAGNLAGAVNGQASLLSRQTQGGNAGLVRAILLNGDGSAVSSSLFASIPTTFELVGIDDVDNNGADDLVYINSATGVVRVVLMTTTGAFLVSVFPTVVPAEYVAVGVGDMNGDGTADLLAEKVSGANIGLLRTFLFQATGSGPATVVTVSGTTFPGTRDLNYEIIELGYSNADARIDMQTVKISGGNEGLIRARLFSDGANGFEGSNFPLVLDSANYDIEGVGNYDGVNQADLAARKTGTPNDGLVRTWSLSADGSGVDGTGFPGFITLEYDITQTGPVLP